MLSTSIPSPFSADATLDFVAHMGGEYGRDDFGFVPVPSSGRVLIDNDEGSVGGLLLRIAVGGIFQCRHFG